MAETTERECVREWLDMFHPGRKHYNEQNADDLLSFLNLSGFCVIRVDDGVSPREPSRAVVER